MNLGSFSANSNHLISYQLLCGCHLWRPDDVEIVFCEEDTSALPDPVLASKHIWPYSPVPDGHRPNEAEEIARRAAQSAVKFMVNDKLTLLGLMMKCTCNESKSC